MYALKVKNAFKGRQFKCIVQLPYAPLRALGYISRVTDVNKISGLYRMALHEAEGNRKQLSNRPWSLKYISIIGPVR